MITAPPTSSPVAPMSARPHRGMGLSLTIAFAAGAVALSFFYAYFLTFSKFRSYDDEGFFLLSTKLLLQGQALYDEITAVYQPFFYFVNWLIFSVAGVELGHDNMRLLTVCLWVAGAAVTGLVAMRLTGSRIIGLLVLAIAMLCLSRFSNDPGHPGSLAYLITTCLVLLFTCSDSLPPRVLGISIGVLTGLLLMVKINIGIYAALPMVCVLAMGTGGRTGRFLELASGVLLLLMPAVLMSARLGNLVWGPASLGFILLLFLLLLAPWLAEEWRLAPVIFPAAAGLAALLLPLVGFSTDAPRQFYGWLLVTLPVSSFLLLARRCRPELDLRLRHWWWLVGACGTAVFLSCLFVLLRGTSAHGLLQGLFLLPAGLANRFYLPFQMNLLGGWLALAGSIGCCGYAWAYRRWPGSSRLAGLSAAGQLALGLLVIADFLGNGGNPSLDCLPQFWPLPFIWLLLAGEDCRPPATRFRRLMLFGITLTQPLIAYPIVGTQLSQSSGMLLIVAAVCLSGGLRFWLPRLVRHHLQDAVKLAAGAVAAMAILYPGQRLVARMASEYASLTPLDLPGSARIRLTEGQARLYQEICKFLVRPEAGAFICMPRLASFHVWTGKDPLPALGTGGWFWILPGEKQEEIWRAIQAEPNLVLIRHRELIRFYAGGRAPDKQPLMRHLEREFTPAMAAYGYEVLIRP